MWYDTHDVSQHLRDSPGPRHAVGLTLAPGWDSRHGTGKEGIEVKLRLSIDLEGGSHVDVVSDETWRGGRGPVAAADVYNGETFVANRTTRGWSKPGFNDSGWANASLGKPPHNMCAPNKQRELCRLPSLAGSDPCSLWPTGRTRNTLSLRRSSLRTPTCRRWKSQAHSLRLTCGRPAPTLTYSTSA